jgi:hypothetical protein
MRFWINIAHTLSYFPAGINLFLPNYPAKYAEKEPIDAIIKKTHT